MAKVVYKYGLNPSPWKTRMQDVDNFIIDFETLATTPHAVVRCLSLIPFKLGKEESIEELLSRQLTVWFDAEGQLEAGRDIDEDTLDFWNRQLNNAQTEAERANAEAMLGRHSDDVHPKEALEIVAAYIQDVAPAGLMYARGSNFDYPIFEDLCRQYGVTLPFSTWKVACSKSILRFACGNDKEVEAGLVAGLKSNHSSAFDCAVEAKKLQVLFTTLNADG